MIVAVAGKCMTGLALGLRKKFAPYAVQVSKIYNIRTPPCAFKDASGQACEVKPHGEPK